MQAEIYDSRFNAKKNELFHPIFFSAARARVELTGKIFAKLEMWQRLTSMVQSMISVTLSLITSKSSLN